MKKSNPVLGSEKYLHEDLKIHMIASEIDGCTILLSGLGQNNEPFFQKNYFQMPRLNTRITFDDRVHFIESFAKIATDKDFAPAQPD
jgi:hypothetical protein